MSSTAAHPSHPPNRSPLDWDLAVRVAAARLKETYVLPDTAGLPTPAAAVQRLAALLCAYGKLAEEADRMQAHAAEPPAAKPAKLKPRRAAPTGKPPRLASPRR